MSGPDNVSMAGHCSCKIGRAGEKYGIDHLDDRLLERRAEGASLRRLETAVNTAILGTILRETEFVGDVDSFYERLTDDDVSAGERTEARTWLSQAGFDPDELTGDFVSYQTVRTHLRECLDVETDRSASLTLDDAQGTIEWARSRSEGIVERTIERLENAGDFETGAFEVATVVRVTCTECATSYTIDTFLKRGGCPCDQSSVDG